MMICKQCKQIYSPSQLSLNGLCHKCAGNNVLDCIKQLRDKKGKYYDRWLTGIRRAVR